MTPVHHASSGEPAGRWKLWAKWLRLVAAWAAGMWVAGQAEDRQAATLAVCAVLVVLMLRYRFLEQQFDLLIDGRPVRVKLYMNVQGRVWIAWTSAGVVRRARIGQWRQVGAWLDHEIGLGARRYPLRIYAKPGAGGYMISNVGRGFEMAVLRNTFCC